MISKSCLHSDHFPSPLGRTVPELFSLDKEAKAPGKEFISPLSFNYKFSFTLDALLSSKKFP